MREIEETVRIVEAGTRDRCMLCGARIPARPVPLCPACDQEVQASLADFRAEQTAPVRRNTPWTIPCS